VPGPQRQVNSTQPRVLISGTTEETGHRLSTSRSHQRRSIVCAIPSRLQEDRRELTEAKRTGSDGMISVLNHASHSAGRLLRKGLVKGIKRSVAFPDKRMLLETDMPSSSSCIGCPGINSFSRSTFAQGVLSASLTPFNLGVL
jgi:hypothetical protein